MLGMSRNLSAAPRTLAEPRTLVIGGGKLTTYRKLAEHAMDKLKPVMGFDTGDWTVDSHLPGGDIPKADFDGFLRKFHSAHSWLDADLAHGHLPVAARGPVLG